MTVLKAIVDEILRSPHIHNAFNDAIGWWNSNVPIDTDPATHDFTDLDPQIWCEQHLWNEYQISKEHARMIVQIAAIARYNEPMTGFEHRQDLAQSMYERVRGGCLWSTPSHLVFDEIAEQYGLQVVAM